MFFQTEHYDTPMFLRERNDKWLYYGILGLTAVGTAGSFKSMYNMM
jgi:hypothetical protein